MTAHPASLPAKHRKLSDRIVFGCNIKTFFRIEKQSANYFLKKNDFCLFFFSGSRSTKTGFIVRGSIPV